ncbi:MAG: ABC transporter ATP-binding protein [Eubacteriales bacterium]
MKQDKKSSGFVRLLRCAAEDKRSLALVLLCSVIKCAADIVSPFIMGRALDKIIDKGQVDFEELYPTVLVLAVIFVAGAVFSYGVRYFSNISAVRTSERLRERAFAYLSSQPVSYFDSSSHGDIVSRFVNDLESVTEGMRQLVLNVFSGIFTVVGTLVFMLYINVRITLVVVAVTALSFVVAYIVTKTTKKYFKEQQLLYGQLSGLAEEYIEGINVVKSFGCEGDVQREFDEINDRLNIIGRKAQFASSLTNPTTRFIGNIAYVAIGVFGGLIGGLSAGQIASFLTYSVQFSTPFNLLTSLMTQLLSAAAASGRVFEIIDSPPEAPDREDAAVLDGCEGEVEFKDVSFAYNPERPLIRHFNAQARQGDKIAIVGPTGAGKTTVVNLLMRFYEPDGGGITVDGKDIRFITRDSLRGCFGMVLQETWLFSGTIRDNIAYSKPDATEEEIIGAAKAAHAHSFITKLKNGYATRISEGADNISQGQKQLLTIARVMLAQPDMLILDEATSSVDTLTEQQIQKGFSAVMKGRTSFIIAHRLSTIRSADLILYMEGGQVLEQGSHEQLIAAGGRYASLYNSQFDSEVE